MKSTIKQWLEVLRQQIIEVDRERKIVTALVVTVFWLEAALMLLCNFIVREPFSYGAVALVSFAVSLVRFPALWPVTDEGIEQHCYGRLHVLAMAVTAISAVLLLVLAPLGSLLKNIAASK